MSLQERIQICSLLSQAYNNPDYARKIGIIDRTEFNGTKAKETSNKRDQISKEVQK